MYNLFTGAGKDGFVYIDVRKDNPLKLGELYIDSFGNELKVVEFANFENHKEFVSEMLRWKSNAKKLNTQVDPSFIPRSRR